MYFHSKTKLKNEEYAFRVSHTRGFPNVNVVGPLIFPHVKVRLKRFHLNGNIIGFHQQTQKLELHTK